MKADPCPQHFPARLERGSPYPLGATWDGLGTNFAVFSAHAERIELCLFDPSGRREIVRLPLPECTDEVWHGYLPNARTGLIYGYRAHGPYNPQEGHRFNPHKLLLDPYARQFAGTLRWSDALFGYRINSPRGDLSLDRRDSAQGMPKAVVTDDFFDWGDDRPPNVPWSRTVIYEAHLRGMTMQRHDIRANERGTFAALGDPEMHRLFAVAGNHRNGTVADPRVRAGPCVDRARLAQLLGLQLDRLLCDRAALPVGRLTERNARRHTPAACRRHRGHSRCCLQPYRRRQRTWPDAIVPRSRQCQLLPARSRQQAALHQRHRNRQHAQPVASARAADWSSTRCAIG